VIAVRVKRNPRLTEEVIKRLELSQRLPDFVKGDIAVWKKALAQWQKEESAQSNQVGNRGKSLAVAKALLDQAALTENYPLGTAALIHYLRASSILADLLRQSIQDKVHGEALYFAGMSSQFLRGLTPWALEESYFDQCVRYQPKSSLAQKCYLKYESLQFAQSGYGETLPKYVEEYLEQLRSIAF
jgi:hypothetical protein